MANIQYIDYSTGTSETLPSAGAKINANFASIVDELKKLDIKSNINASRAPTRTDDERYGYEPRSLWFDKDSQKAYICLSSEEGTALWVEISPQDPQTASEVFYDDSNTNLSANNVQGAIEALNSSVSNIVAGVSSVDGMKGDVDLSESYEPKRKHNFTATQDPTSDNDVTEGYEKLSKWINTSTMEVFVCLDASKGNANWQKTTLTVDELGSAATADISDFAPASHAEDKNNPHEVTAEQVGADPKGTAESKVSEHENTYNHNSYDDHLTDENNPHNVTASQVGAYTKEEADAATENAIEEHSAKDSEVHGAPVGERLLHTGDAGNEYAAIEGGESADFVAMPLVGGAPIVESGSNSEGQWVRWADGTQIISGRVNVGKADALGDGSYSDPWRTSPQNVTLPKEFIVAPSVTVSKEVNSDNDLVRAGGASFRNVDTKFITDLQAYSHSVSGFTGDVFINYVAIGRWK